MSPLFQSAYNLARNKTLSLNYSGYTSPPGFTQLQPVIDFSNALYPVEGNPHLHPQFTSKSSLDFNNINISSVNSFFCEYGSYRSPK